MRLRPEEPRPLLVGRERRAVAPGLRVQQRRRRRVGEGRRDTAHPVGGDIRAQQVVDEAVGIAGMPGVGRNDGRIDPQQRALARNRPRQPDAAPGLVRPRLRERDVGAPQDAQADLAARQVVHMPTAGEIPDVRTHGLEQFHRRPEIVHVPAVRIQAEIVQRQGYDFTRRDQQEDAAIGESRDDFRLEDQVVAVGRYLRHPLPDAAFVEPHPGHAPHVGDRMGVARIGVGQNRRDPGVEMAEIAQFRLVELPIEAVGDLPLHEEVARKHHVETAGARAQPGVQGFVGVVGLVRDPDAGLLLEIRQRRRRQGIEPAVDVEPPLLARRSGRGRRYGQRGQNRAGNPPPLHSRPPSAPPAARLPDDAAIATLPQQSSKVVASGGSPGSRGPSRTTRAGPGETAIFSLYKAGFFV